MKTIAKGCKAVFDILLILIFFFPFYWMLITGFKTLGETMTFPLRYSPKSRNGRILQM